MFFLDTCYLPSIGLTLQDNAHLTLEELTSQIIMEILFMIGDGNDPWKQLKIENSMTDTKDLSEDNSTINPMEGVEQTMEVSASNSESEGCPVPSLPTPSQQTPIEQAVSCLLRFYSNIAVEERQHPKKSSVLPLCQVLSDLRVTLVQHLVLTLQGKFYPNSFQYMSLLTPYILAGTVPRGLLSELASQTYLDETTFSSIFTPILWGILEAMQNASVADQEHVRPLEALGELAEVRCGFKHTVRPVARLFAALDNFCPETCTTVPGREIAKISFLGPFFSISLFAEENPKLAYKMFTGINGAAADKSLAFALQKDIEHSRVVLHGVCHAILLSTARAPLLKYFATLLKHNEKRTQLQSEEKTLAGEFQIFSY